MTITWGDRAAHEAVRARHGRYWISVLGLALADGASFVLAHLLFRSGHNVPAVMLFLGGPRDGHSVTLNVFYLISAAFVAVRYLSGDYNRRQLFWDGAKTTTIALIIASLPDILMLILGHGLYPAGPLAESWICLLAALPLVRQAMRAVMTQFGVWQIPTAIIGVSAKTAEVYEALNHSLALGFAVRWLVLDDLNVQAPPEMAGLRMIYSSDATRIASMVCAAGCKEAIITAENMQSAHFAELIQRLFEVNIPVAIIPSFNRLPLAGVSANYFFGRDILLLQARSNVQRLPWRFAKRLFDIFASLLLLILFVPVFVVLAIAIKRADAGKVIYSQERIGRHGKPFKCLKFRTMVTDADACLQGWLKDNPALYAEYLVTFKLQEDPRITPVGRWLRRTSLDELPQLLNVLRGEMSLVGPRPVILQELEKHYGPATQLYMQIRPGMTGLWQVSGRSDTSYERRVILDEWYILNWSFWYDIVILIQTLWIVVRGKGAV